jgi:hypothetical protein
MARGGRLDGIVVAGPATDTNRVQRDRGTARYAEGVKRGRHLRH